MATFNEVEQRTTSTFPQFLSAINVWIYRPHVINKRLSCSIVSCLDSESSDEYIQIMTRELIPKSTAHAPGHDTVTINHINKEVYFVPGTSCSEYHSYSFKHTTISPDGSSNFKVLLSFQHSTISDTLINEGVAYPKRAWLETILLPKLCQWAESLITTPTLPQPEIIPIGRYCYLYKELKEKYGPSLISNWTESTDPYKFVYEDIAIATYLLVVWEEERSRSGLTHRQSFVDLGCGNGLLVYLLNSEGHPGKGIDLRSRRIWTQLQPQATLEVSTLTPSSATLFPEFDWLIGNHSDELTPWIPVIAARSSYNVRFFVLPCCPHDFDRKFSRPVCDKSQYRCYLDYVKEISSVMGFTVQEDTLRIPSSKRVCIIGQCRSYSVEEESIIEEKRSKFIKDRLTKTSAQLSCHGDSWAEHFKPRPSIEAVRNCSTVDMQIQADIVATVTSVLLSKDERCIHLADGRSWNRGGVMSINDIVKLFDKETFVLLKNECGGLNTLLKNHCQIFEVHSGMVQLRDWSKCEGTIKSHKSNEWKKRENQLLHKTKLCWFYTHHPQGCPRSSETCPYAHGETELRQRPKFNISSTTDIQ